MDTIKQEFHSLNNWLNKITMLSGQTRYELETKGLDLAQLEDEKKKLIKLLNDLEEYALRMGDGLRNLRKVIEGTMKPS